MKFITQDETDRVRRNTPPALNQRIDRKTEDNIRRYAVQSREAVDQRIAELRSEWSIERFLQLNVAAVGLTSVALALTTNRKWGLVTCVALAMFMTHQIQGFDPPLPLLRKLGVRTRAEIDEEIYALKVMRGDFESARRRPVAASQDEVESALRAVGV
jgi:hypothetical protein